MCGNSSTSLIEGASVRRQTEFQGCDEICIVMHSFVVTGFFLRYLSMEARGLIFGVVQLGETVGDLASTDEQLKAVSHLRIVVVASGEW